jgi:hypothetical protein
MNHVGKEAKDDPSKTPRLLMGPEEVTKLKKTGKLYDDNDDDDDDDDDDVNYTNPVSKRRRHSSVSVVSRLRTTRARNCG